MLSPYYVSLRCATRKLEEILADDYFAQERSQLRRAGRPEQHAPGITVLLSPEYVDLALQLARQCPAKLTGDVALLHERGLHYLPICLTWIVSLITGSMGLY